CSTCPSFYQVSSSLSYQYSVLLSFSPASVLAVAKAKSPSQDLSLPSGPYSRVPSLGLVLFLLKNIAAYFFHQSQTSSGKAAVKQPIDKVIVPQVQRSLLVQLINNRAKLLAFCSYVIETCLFVLWRHLEYDLLYCTPTDLKDSLMPGASEFVFSKTDSSLPCVSSCRVTWGAGFGEALQRKLQEVKGLNSQVRSHSTFIQALVRRIQGLLHQPKS
uniref:Uncharacterized protein n=1 Tax=Oncorhynchus kisutch TaxID=8019 RepID=A0A8C7G7V7_ONCKI